MHRTASRITLSTAALVTLFCTSFGAADGTDPVTSFSSDLPLLLQSSHEKMTSSACAPASTNLSFSVIFGGGEARAIATDDSGYIYVVGTAGFGFPVVNAIQPARGGGVDAFVAKLTPFGDSLIFSTFLGGSLLDNGQAIVLDGDGNVVITGTTASDDFPVVDEIQMDPDGAGSYDAFVVKMSGDGSAIIYSTYVGGSSEDRGLDLAIDDSGDVYIVGETLSPDFPTKNAYQDTSSMGGIFVMKLEGSGDSVIYSTYLNAGAVNGACGIDVDSAGQAYVCAAAYLNTFPTINAYQPSIQGGTDATLTKFTAAGDNLVFSTLLGGTGNDYAVSVKVGSGGEAVVTGNTESADFPITAGVLPRFGQVFVTRFQATGGALVVSTYLGVEGEAWDMALDAQENVWVAGVGGRSLSWPCWSGGSKFNDAFVAQLCSGGDSRGYTARLTGTGRDEAYGVDVGAAGNIVVCGIAGRRDDFPTTRFYGDPSVAGGAFALKLDVNCPVQFTGDVDGSCRRNSSDIIALVNYVFKSGPEPQPCAAAGDVNCNGAVSSADIIDIVNYIFKGGPPPCNVCALIPSVWSCP